MVTDTIFVVMLCIIPASHTVSENRFTDSFEKADKDFEKKYHLDIKELKKASAEAAKEAYESTKFLLKTDSIDFYKILKKLDHYESK